MIVNCYFNSRGYYIFGDAIEICGATPVSQYEEQYDELQHLYLVMITVLTQLKGLKKSIYLFNDSRLIDDMNSSAATLGPWYDKIRSLCKRNIIPEILGPVFFKKFNSKFIDDQISLGFKRLCIDNTEIQEILKAKLAAEEAKHSAALKNKVSNLKKEWFHGHETNGS